MSEWKTVKFEDLFAAPLRNGVSYPSKQRGSGIPMVNMKELFAYDRIADQDCELAPLTENEIPKYSLLGGDLLFARQSLSFAGAGRCVLVVASQQIRTWESHLIRVRLDQERADPEFYYYYFRSPRGRHSIESIIQQVAAAGIRGSDLARLELPMPRVETQKAIAAVLRSLDDKIDSNIELAQTADHLIRAAHAALRADGRISIHDLVKIRREAADPGALGPETTYVGLEHLPRRNMWMSDTGVAGSVTSGKSRFVKEDILFGKLRPYFHKVVSAAGQGICSTDIMVLTPNRIELSGFALASIASDAVVAEVTAASEGTRMPRTNWKDLASVEVPWPGDDEALEFSRSVSVIRDSVTSYIAENRMLAELRDTLLPELMSGRLRVKDAEKKIEEVV